MIHESAAEGARVVGLTRTIGNTGGMKRAGARADPKLENPHG
jgi:hypothetical protein